MGWKIKKANSTWIFPQISLSKPQWVLWISPHVGECGCVSEWNFHLLLSGYLAPAIRIQLFPEVGDKSSQLFCLKEQDTT